MNHKEIINHIKINGNPEEAVIHKNYHKSGLQFFGWRIPDLRRLASQISKNINNVDFFILCGNLWAHPVFETRMLVIFMLSKNLKYFSEDDFKRFHKWFRDCGCWSVTDSLTIFVFGEYLRKYPQFNKQVDQWKNDEHLWVRRAGILRFITPARYKKPWLQDMEKILIHHFPEKDFFIRKSLGWTLREWSKHEPQKVLDFANKYKDNMASLTYREAVRNIKCKS